MDKVNYNDYQTLKSELENLHWLAEKGRGINKAVIKFII